MCWKLSENVAFYVKNICRKPKKRPSKIYRCRTQTELRTEIEIIADEARAYCCSALRTTGRWRPRNIKTKLQRYIYLASTITICTANNNYTNIVHVHFGSCFIYTYIDTDDPRARIYVYINVHAHLYRVLGKTKTKPDRIRGNVQMWETKRFRFPNVLKSSEFPSDQNEVTSDTLWSFSFR